MIETNMEAVVERHMGFLGDSYQMFLFRNSLDLADGKIHVVQDITMTVIEVGQMRPAPSIMLSQKGAVRLMDTLWQSGVRPSASTLMSSDEKQTYNTLVAAKDAHISDLREIVFNRLGVEAQAP